MPTYNRLYKPGGDRLIAEAVQSFLMQDYPNKELIILNDTPGQKLIVSAPGVVVYNFNERFASLGDKCNAGIQLATGQYVTRWDDDDISLPKRLSKCVDRLQDGAIGVLVVAGYWWLNGEYSVCEGRYGFQQDLYSASLIRRVGYRPISNGEDQAIRKDCLQAAGENNVRVAEYLPTADEFHYIYRWANTENYHLSDSHSDTERRYREIGQFEIKRGSFLIKPVWYRDYESETQCQLQSSVES